MGSDSKWFLCFRPSATLEIDLSGDGAVDCSADTVLTYITAAKKSSKEMKKKKKHKDKSESSKGKRTVTPISDNQKDENCRNPLRKSFSGVIKSVLFGSATRWKARETKFQKFPEGSITKSSDQSKGSVDRKTADDIFQVAADVRGRKNATAENSPVSAAADERLSPPRTSSEGSNRRQNGFYPGRRRSGEEEGAVESSFRMNHQVVCLVLLSLWVTVFWGRFLAVMTTTVGIYAWESRRAAALVLASLGKRSRTRMKMQEKAEWGGR